MDKKKRTEELSKVLNSRRTFNIGGREFEAQRNDLQDLADFEEHIRSQHAMSFLESIDKLPIPLDSTVISKTLSGIYTNVLTAEEKMNVARSIVGARFFLMRMLQKCDPSLTAEEVCPLVTLENLQQVMNEIDEFNIPTVQKDDDDNSDEENGEDPLDEKVPEKQ